MLNWCTIRSRAARPTRARSSLLCRIVASMASASASGSLPEPARLHRPPTRARRPRPSQPRVFPSPWPRQEPAAFLPTPTPAQTHRRHQAAPACRGASPSQRTCSGSPFPRPSQSNGARHHRQKRPPLRPQEHRQSKAPHSASPCALAGRLATDSESPWQEPRALRSATQSRNQRLIASRVECAALGIGRKLSSVDSVRPHEAFVPGNCFQPNKPLCGGLAHRHGALAQPIRQPVRHHAHPAAFIYVVHGGDDHRARHSRAANNRANKLA